MSRDIYHNIRILTRIGKARAAFLMLRKVWCSREISFRTKLRIFRSNVKSVLLYGAETWRTTIRIKGRIQSFINNCFRRIFGLCWQDKVTNEEQWHWAREVPVSIQIRRRKWGWLGHTLRKPTNNITRQALSWNPQGRRKRGRPRNSWRRDLEKEVIENGWNWTELGRRAQNRVRWRKLVKAMCVSK